MLLLRYMHKACLTNIKQSNRKAGKLTMTSKKISKQQEPHMIHLCIVQNYLYRVSNIICQKLCAYFKQKLLPVTFSSNENKKKEILLCHSLMECFSVVEVYKNYKMSYIRRHLYLMNYGNKITVKYRKK